MIRVGTFYQSYRYGPNLRLDLGIGGMMKPGFTKPDLLNKATYRPTIQMLLFDCTPFLTNFCPLIIRVHRFFFQPEIFRLGRTSRARYTPTNNYNQYIYDISILIRSLKKQ